MRTNASKTLIVLLVIILICTLTLSGAIVHKIADERALAKNLQYVRKEDLDSQHRILLQLSEELNATIKKAKENYEQMKNKKFEINTSSGSSGTSSSVAIPPPPTPPEPVVAPSPPPVTTRAS